jgi:hypothetical protein
MKPRDRWVADQWVVWELTSQGELKKMIAVCMRQEHALLLATTIPHSRVEPASVRMEMKSIPRDSI